MQSINQVPSVETSRLGLIAGLSFLLVVLLPIRFSIGPVQMTSVRLFLLLAALPVAIAWLRNKPLRSDLSAWFFAGAIAWSALAISQTSPDHLWENTGVLWLEMLCAYLLGRLCIGTDSDFAKFVLWTALSLTILLPITIFEASTGAPPIIYALSALPLISSVDIVSIPTRLGLERAQVVFAHPIHFGLFATTGFALVLLGLRDHLKTPQRTAMAAISALSVFLSLSSGPILALVLQAAFLVWVVCVGSARRGWLLLILLILAAYLAIDLISNRTPIRVFMSYATFSPHNAFWRGLIFEWGMINVWNNPVFGIGYNEWERPSFMISGSIDNYWLATAMRYGIPTFVCVAIGFLLAIRRAVQLDHQKITPLRLGWVLTIITIVLALCTVHIWTAIHAYVFFLLGAGQFRNAHNNRHKAQPAIAPVHARELTAGVYTRDGISA